MRKKVIISALMILSVVTVSARSISYQVYDSVKVVRLLSEAQHKPRQINFPLFFAMKFIGVPYVAHTLDGSSSEHLIVNLRQLDCTTLIENVTALCLCVYHRTYSFRAFCTNLTLVRYRNGFENGYASRLHYFSEWISDGKKKETVQELQSTAAPFTAEQKINVNFMSKHPDAYYALRNDDALTAQIADVEKQLSGHVVRYIPKTIIRKNDESLSCIMDGDILAIVTSKKGLDVAHLGLAKRHSDGKLHLLNASMTRKRVVDEDTTLADYLDAHPTFIGIRVIRITK
jgi:hypothetical protein